MRLVQERAPAFGQALSIGRPGRSEPTQPTSVLAELAAVDAQAARIASRVYRRRRGVELSADGLILCVNATFAGSSAADPDGMAVDISFTIDGRPALLRLPRCIVDRLMARIDPDLSSRTVDGGFAALLTEFVVAEALGRLESRLGHRIAFLSVHRSGGAVPLDVWQPIHLAVTMQGEASNVVLFLDERQADLAAGLFATLPADPIDAGDLPIEIALRIGVARLSAGELASLRPNDVVFLEQQEMAHDRIAVVVAERWLFLARMTRSGVSLMTPRLRADAPKMEAWTMGEPNADAVPTGASTDADFDELPIRLVFEIARQSVSLGELRTLAPGYVFDFGRDLTRSVSIYGNGRHIGHGELVRIGDALGLRVTRLFGNE